MIIDGEAIASDIRNDISESISEMQGSPKLVAVLMSNDPASETYIRMKRKACDEVGIESEVHEIDPSESQDVLSREIESLNNDPEVNGIIVQLPLPERINEFTALESVSPLKDVDGFHPMNRGYLMEGRPRFIPATPRGVLKLLIESGYPPEGKDTVIVGRSNIVGKPLANLLIRKKQKEGNSTVTLCHSKTDSLEQHTKRADILISAVGAPEMINKDMVSEGVVAIDVGINRVDADNEKGYRLVGDIAFEEVKNKASAITPVPGGVGPMTVAMLLKNTVEAYRLQR